MVDEILEGQQDGGTVTPETPAGETPAGEKVIQAAKPAIEGEGSEKPGVTKKPNPVQPRIDQLTREKNEERRAREALQKEVAELRVLVGGKETGFSEPKPKREDFLDKPEIEDPDGTYLDAIIDWNRKKDKFESAKENAKNASANAVNERRARLEDKTATAVDQYGEEFTKTALSPELATVLTDDVRDAVTDSPYFAELAMELGKNLALTRELGGLSGRALDRAIGVMEAKIIGQKAAASPKAGEKPDKNGEFVPPRLPGKPTPGSQAHGEFKLEDLSMEEFAKVRNREELRGG